MWYIYYFKTTDDTCGAETAYPFGTPGFIPDF